MILPPSSETRAIDRSPSRGNKEPRPRSYCSHGMDSVCHLSVLLLATTLLAWPGSDAVEHIGQWLREERDFMKDYRDAFGEDPLAVTAVAVMVDTDNIRGTALSWFDSIEVETHTADAAASLAR